MTSETRLPRIEVYCPDWVDEVVDWERFYPDDDAKMGIAVALSRENVLRETGGPFGAAVFEAGTGRLVAAGVNRVVSLNNSALHGEMVALMLAEARVGSFTLGGPGGTAHELVTSCEPCAMCLGAILWSGVARVVCGATGDDARELGFDEGPVFHESYSYLRARGVELVFAVRRDEARAVLELYRDRSGPVYNG